MYWGFFKNSFSTIYRLSILVIMSILLIILTRNFETVKIFNDSIVIDNFSKYIKSLILISSIFILSMSKKYLIDNKIDKFEYPIIVLLSILGMFIMVSSNDLIVFYLGLELQSFSIIYISCYR